MWSIPGSRVNNTGLWKIRFDVPLGILMIGIGQLAPKVMVRVDLVTHSAKLGTGPVMTAFCPITIRPLIHEAGTWLNKPQQWSYQTLQVRVLDNRLIIIINTYKHFHSPLLSQWLTFAFARI